MGTWLCWGRYQPAVNWRPTLGIACYLFACAIETGVKHRPYEPYHGSERRKKADISMAYKILHETVDIDKDQYFEKASSRTRATHSLKLRHQSAKKDVFKFSFFVRVVPIWNSLPAPVEEASSFGIFKQGLQKLDF